MKQLQASCEKPQIQGSCKEQHMYSICLNQQSQCYHQKLLLMPIRYACQSICSTIAAGCMFVTKSACKGIAAGLLLAATTAVLGLGRAAASMLCVAAAGSDGMLSEAAAAMCC